MWSCGEEHSQIASLNTIHALLDHGADCNVTDLQGCTPLLLYLRNGEIKQSELSLSLLERVINKSYLSGDICLAMYACLMVRPGALALQQKLLQWLPACHLNVIINDCDWQTNVVLVINHHESCRIAVTLHDDKMGLDAACKLLTETSIIHGCIRKADYENVSNRPQIQMKKEQVGWALEHFVLAECQVWPLTKLCALSIRLHMPSKRDDDFDRLGLPARLRSLVTYEHLFRELEEMGTIHCPTGIKYFTSSLNKCLVTHV
jgi:hypothetical protein